MKSFTAMSDEAIEATITAMEETGEDYSLTLNRSDFAMFMRALQVSWEFGETDNFTPGWSYDFASGIAETLDVEMI